MSTIKAQIGDTVFEFRRLRRAEFVQVQDIMGNPTGDSPKLAAAFQLALQTTVVASGPSVDALKPCTARDLNAALDEAPGAIVVVGGAVYGAATAGAKILSGE